jgi:hypothetical protein
MDPGSSRRRCSLDQPRPSPSQRSRARNAVCVGAWAASWRNDSARLAPLLHLKRRTSEAMARPRQAPRQLCFLRGVRGQGSDELPCRGQASNVKPVPAMPTGRGSSRLRDTLLLIGSAKTIPKPAVPRQKCSMRGCVDRAMAQRFPHVRPPCSTQKGGPVKPWRGPGRPRASHASCEGSGDSPEE